MDQDREPRRERFDVVVIGGGQAGLAVGHHLARHGLDFVILEARPRIGDSWRERWDRLHLFTRARYDGLPGMPFPAPGHVLPSKDEVATYVEAYATRMNLPVRTGVRVDRLIWSELDDRFLVSAGHLQIEALQIVVATGAYNRPNIPGFASLLDPTIKQLHSSEYRNPAQLREGPVLVVGASNSGAEIALDAAARHRTILSGRDTGKMPVRPESRLGNILDRPFWFFLNHVATLSTPIGRKALPFVRDHGGPLERIWPTDLAAAGVERVLARTTGARGGQPVLDDGRVLDVANVVWCTGFRPDFDWIKLPVVGSDGWPLHVRGVASSVPGLYFVGLPFLHSAASALLGGVGRDAAYVVGRVAERGKARLSARRQAAAATAGGPIDQVVSDDIVSADIGPC